MTFIEAISWMSESENHITTCYAGTYKINNRNLMYQNEGEWCVTSMNINSLTTVQWTKLTKKKTIELHECVSMRNGEPAELIWLTESFIYDTTFRTGETRTIEIDDV